MSLSLKYNVLRYSVPEGRLASVPQSFSRSLSLGIKAFSALSWSTATSERTQSSLSEHWGGSFAASGLPAHSYLCERVCQQDRFPWQLRASVCHALGTAQHILCSTICSTESKQACSSRPVIAASHAGTAWHTVGIQAMFVD